MRMGARVGLSGGGEGLHPLTTGGLREMDKCWPPALSTTFVAAPVPFTPLQLARGVNPEHVDGRQLARRPARYDRLRRDVL